MLMNRRSNSRFPASIVCFLTAIGLLAIHTRSLSAQDETTLRGTISSVSRNTLTLRLSNGQYQLFSMERNTIKPTSLAVGSEVRVTSSAGDDPGVRVAKQITLASSPEQTTVDPVIPAEVRRVERDIERQARRFQLGLRAGVGLDPELLLIGTQIQIGPFFNRDVFFRPNVEFGWGEVTALFALSPEIIYRLPISSRNGRWSTYVGAGPGFNFLHQNFERREGGQRIDFGEFHSDVGLNILGGIRYRSGLFTEFRTSVYSETSPTLRLIVGYNF